MEDPSGTFKVVIISLPHWIQKAVQQIHDLAELLGTFCVVSVMPIHQIVDPEELVKLGYVGDFKIPTVGTKPGSDCDSRLGRRRRREDAKRGFELRRRRRRSAKSLMLVLPRTAWMLVCKAR